MAKNSCGFIQKKYTQPVYYKELFGNYNAVYYTKSGKEIMVEACPHHLTSEKFGAKIDHYNILLQEPNCRKQLYRSIIFQKQAMELLEKCIEKY